MNNHTLREDCAFFNVPKTNSFATLPADFYTRLPTTALKDPVLVHANPLVGALQLGVATQRGRTHTVFSPRGWKSRVALFHTRVSRKPGNARFGDTHNPGTFAGECERPRHT